MQRAIDDLPAADKKWELPFDGPDAFNQTFDCWVRQMGYPLVRAVSSSEVTTLSQVRYLQYGGLLEINLPRSSLNYLWNVPISYITPARDNSLGWLLNDGSDLVIHGELGKDIWIDPESMGFMRIQYGSPLEFKQVLIPPPCGTYLNYFYFA